jgi:predicted esterase
VLLTHGDADSLVPIAGTVALDDQLCARHIPTEFLREATWDHTTAWLYALDQADAWIQARINGETPPSNCP